MIGTDHRIRLASTALKKGGSLALIYNYSPLPSEAATAELSSNIAAESSGVFGNAKDYEKDIERWVQDLPRRNRGLR